MNTKLFNEFLYFFMISIASFVFLHSLSVWSRLGAAEKNIRMAFVVLTVCNLSCGPEKWGPHKLTQAPLADVPIEWLYYVMLFVIPCLVIGILQQWKELNLLEKFISGFWILVMVSALASGPQTWRWKREKPRSARTEKLKASQTIFSYAHAV